MSVLQNPFLLPKQKVSILLVTSALFWASCSALWLTCHSLKHSDLAVCNAFSMWIAKFSSAFFDGDDKSNEIIGGIALTTLFASTGSYIILFFFRGERNLSHAYTTCPSSGAEEGQVSRSRFRNPLKNVGKGNPNVRLWTHIMVTVPFLIQSFHPLWDKWDDIQENGMSEVVGHLANPTGMGAIVALSWFMVPVARQSPLLVALGVNPVHALYFHIWAGRLCLVGSFLHTLFYLLIYIDFNEDATKSWLAVCVSALFPPKACWVASMPWSHVEEAEAGKDGGENHGGDGEKGGHENDTHKEGGEEHGHGNEEGGHENDTHKEGGEEHHGHGNEEGGHEKGSGEAPVSEMGDGENVGDKKVAMNMGWTQSMPFATTKTGLNSGSRIEPSQEKPGAHDRMLWYEGDVWLPPVVNEDWSTSRILQHGHGHGHGHGSSCYGYWRNFTGFISVSSLILLVILSLNSIRRKYYKFFYVSHIILGSLMLFFAMVHWSKVSLYLLPTLLYYFACTIPSVVQMAATFFGGGAIMEKTTFIAKSSGCAEIVFSKGRHATEMETAESGLYVRLCVPEISLMWHPFTIASTPDDPTMLKVLFRKYGSFTTKFYNRLSMSGKPPPKILVDAFYGGGTDWATRALGHDAVLLVAGGIGVTPFLSMISLLHSSIANANGNHHSPPSLRRVEFHWYTRDEGLARFVLEKHFALLTNSGGVLNSDDNDSICKFEIVIHCTQQGFDQDLLFTGQDISIMPNTVAVQHDPDEDTDIANADSPPDKTEDDTDLESDPTADVVVSYNFRHGSDVDISRFNLCRSYRYIRNFPSALVFLVTSVLGTRLIWKQNHNPPERTAIMARAHALWLIILISLSVGILAEFVWWLHAKFFSRTTSEKYSGLGDLDDNDASGDNTTKRLDLPHESSIEGRVNLSIRAENGRPLVNNVVNGILGSENPAAFLCGPERLLSCIKEACRSDEKCWRPSRRVKFYEEHFEM